MPLAAHEDSVTQQKTNTQDNSEAKKTGNAGSSPSQSSVSSKAQLSPSSKQLSVHSPSVSDKKSLLSEYKNKILTRGVLSKSQLPSRKTGELEPDLQSTEVTDDRDSSSQEATTSPPKAQDQRRNVKPLSPSRPIHPVLASGRMSVRTHTSEVSSQMSTEEHEPPARLPSSAQHSSASSVPRYTDNETKQLRQSSNSVPSKTSSQPVPAKSNGLVSNVEGKPDPVLVKVSSKASEPGHQALPLSRQSAVSHEGVSGHRSRSGSLGRSHQPASKSADSHARNSHNELDSEEAEDGAGQPSSRSQQTRQSSGSSSRTWKDSKSAAAAVSSRSAVPGYTSPHSRSSTSAKSKGKDVDKNYREDSQEENPLFPSLPSSRQSSSAIYSKRRNPGPDSRSRETHGEKSPHSDSEEQQSQTAAPEKHSHLQSSLSKSKPEEQGNRGVKEKLARSKPSESLPRKTLSSRLPVEKTSHSEPPQRAQTSPSILHSRGRRLPSHHAVSSQSNEELQEEDDEDETEGSDRASRPSVFLKEVSSSRGLSASFSQGSSSSSQSKKQQTGSQVPSYKPKHTQPDSSSASDTAKDSQYNQRLSHTSRQTRPSLPTRSGVAARTASQTEKKKGLLPSKMSNTELPQKVPSPSSSKSHQSVSNEEDDYYSEYDQKEMEEKPTSLAAKRSPSVSRGNKNVYEDTASNTRKSMDTLLPHKVSSEEEEMEKPSILKMSPPESPRSSATASQITQSSNKHTPSKPSFVWPRSSASTTTHTISPAVSSTSSPRQRLLNSRLGNPSQRQFVRPPYRPGILPLLY